MLSIMSDYIIHKVPPQTHIKDHSWLRIYVLLKVIFNKLNRGWQIYLWRKFEYPEITPTGWTPITNFNTLIIACISV